MFRYCGVALEFEYICGHSKNVLKIKMAYETDLKKNIISRKNSAFIGKIRSYPVPLLPRTILFILRSFISLQLKNT